ncbi:hypothetical protein C4707_24705 [Salmonella enterica subsp. enterica serovar Newport]|nr:hypothetical protein C4707_24705 [Salmonella enterica subsp. enterica serovar Newport]
MDSLFIPAPRQKRKLRLYDNLQTTSQASPTFLKILTFYKTYRCAFGSSCHERTGLALPGVSSKSGAKPNVITGLIAIA